MDQLWSLLVGGVQWNLVHKEIEQIYFDCLMKKFELLLHKKLVHKKLKSFQ